MSRLLKILRRPRSKYSKYVFPGYIPRDEFTYDDRCVYFQQYAPSLESNVFVVEWPIRIRGMKGRIEFNGRREALKIALGCSFILEIVADVYKSYQQSLLRRTVRTRTNWSWISLDRGGSRNFRDKDSTEGLRMDFSTFLHFSKSWFSVPGNVSKCLSCFWG